MVRLRGFEKLTGLNDALNLLKREVKVAVLGVEELPLKNALGRLLAEDVKAERDSPPFDRSVMDGYAVRSEDTLEASPFNPKKLKLTTSERVEKGEARVIWTGNPLPEGADAIVRIENTQRRGEVVEVLSPTTPGRDVSRKGEDVKRGEVAVKKGTRLTPQHLGLLASLGVRRVKVARRPKVAILSTGDEVVSLENEPKPGQIVDSNKLILSAMCIELGAEPIDLGIAKDDPEEIKERLSQGLENADVTVTSGGTSVGLHDLIPEVINQLGEPGILIHGVAIRPAMPTAFAIIKEKPVFALSGNPVAAMIGFELFVRPTLLRLQGVKDESRPIVLAKLTRRVASILGSRSYLRVLTFEKDGEFYAEPLKVTGSGIIRTMTKANGYVVIPEDLGGLEEGETVKVHLFGYVEVLDGDV